ncbi:MAG TPA: fimbria/pilus outer membrane usher protein [Burkholderiales bacterium]|nr:fimbria/pilus outer membrane usher protein [Burkholderiales bacterium]
MARKQLAFQEALLLVDVNDQHLDQTVLVLIDASGAPWISADDLKRWRLKTPDVTPRRHQGQVYFPLAAIVGAHYTIDQAKQTLTITAPPAAFASHLLTEPTRNYAAAVPPQPGGFFNYDLSFTQGSGLTQRSGLFEAGYFDRHGVLIGDFLSNDLGPDAQTIRLDTSWQHDNPDNLTTLRVGDAISRPGAWGRSVRFGGIQYGTNFATQPGFITFPITPVAGQAVLPSTVDVYVNNARVAQQQVAPGPFAISNVPIVTGSGNVQLVVTDPLGRQQIITRPFYASENLLRPGLSDYSYELGFVRNDFGLTSNDYGAAIGSATYRRGLSDRLTGELHGELMRDQQTLGASASYLWRDFGVATGSVASSHSDAGAGELFALGFQRQSPTLSFGAQGQWTSSDFRQIGVVAGLPVPAQQYSGNASYNLGRYGSVGAAYVEQRFRDASAIKVASVNYSIPLARRAFLGFSAIKTYGDDGNLTFFTTLTIPFGGSTSAGVEVRNTRQSDNNTGDSTYFVQRSLPTGEGLGYRLQWRDHDEYQASASYQNNVGAYTVEAAQSGGVAAQRVGVSGGVGMIAGHPFLARRIDDSFGLVKVADYPKVRVMQDNHVVGRTDADGYAVLPRMRAYEPNPISVKQQDLPLDAELDKLTINAVPYYRSGVFVNFPVRHARGATLHLKRKDGSDMPPGAVVAIAGQNETFPVAYNGLVYVTGLSRHNELTATWHGQSCKFEVDYPGNHDPLPDLGDFTCAPTQ